MKSDGVAVGSAVVLAAAMAACDGDRHPVPAAPSPQTVAVVFALEAPPPVPPPDPMVAAAAQYCVRNMLGRSSLTFGFSERTYYMDELSPGVAQVTVPVPVGQTHVVVVRSIYACGQDPSGNGVVVRGLSANGVPLEEVTTFPFTDTPALRFVVSAVGDVRP